VALEDGNTPDTARIWKKHIIEREGHVLGDGDQSTILPGDFTLPADDIIDRENLEVTLESLQLSPAVDSIIDAATDGKSTPMSEAISSIKNYSAKMTFIVISLDNGIKKLSFDISYDIQFVTAHPCIPSHYTSLLDSPTSPLYQEPKTPPLVEDSELGQHKLFVGMLISLAIIP
jgi:hypothetical protein